MRHTHHPSNLMDHKKVKTATVIALVTPQQSLAQTEAYLTELTSLADTLELKVIKKFIQKIDHPHGTTFVRKGKLAEIAAFIQAEKVDYAIFDDELSPSQVRNLEKLLSAQILDRNLLILNIFSMRAQTKQARTQVALAQYQYLLPRLTRMWPHLSSSKGGGAGIHGPGEKELETDKRRIQQKITKLREKLVCITQQCMTKRKGRADWVRVALVGYTNVGKSTLMQRLSKTDIVADNKLFATVDATVRKVVCNGHPFLLTDTVGFIRKLPHTLVECFKSTLAEVTAADLLLHIIDVAHNHFPEQIGVVSQTLAAIGAEKLPRILVFNKMDLIEQNQERISKTTHAMDPAIEIALRSGAYSPTISEHSAVFISATQALHIDLLKETITKAIERIQGSRYIQANY